MSDLEGRRVLVTRTEDGCRDWATEIEARGGEAVSYPCIRVGRIADRATGERLRRALATADWLALSSPRAVAAVAELLEAGPPESLAVAVVGPATAAAAEAELGRVDLQAPDGTGRSLAEALRERLGDPGGSVVTAAAEGGRRDLEDVLEPAGIRVVRVDVYRTEPMPAQAPRRPLAVPVDVILLASPSAVQGLTARVAVPPDIDIVTIGPTTSAAAREAGLAVTAEARKRSLEGMLEVIP